MSFVLGIPRCNEPAKIFAETLTAVRASTVKPLAVFVIDNGDTPLEIGEREWPSDAASLAILRSDRNLGCAGAWNKIQSLATDAMEDIVITLNGDCAVPPDAFERMLESPYPAFLCAFGFGCFRLDRKVYNQIGPFDEKFYPVYFEDTDYRYRAKLAGITIEEWPFVEKERLSFGRALYTTGFSHGWRYEDGKGYQGWTDEKLAWFYECWNKNRARYIDKWGGLSGEETFTKPFDGAPE